MKGSSGSAIVQVRKAVQNRGKKKKTNKNLSGSCGITVCAS